MFKMLQRAKTGLLLLDQAIFSGTSFLVTIMLARMLPVEDFGIYAGLVLIFYLITSLISAFVAQPLQVSLAATQDTRSYLAFTFWLQTAGVLLSAGVLYMLFSLPIEVLSAYGKLIGPAVFLSVGFIMHDYFRKRLLAEDLVAETFKVDLLLMAGHFFVIGYVLLQDTHSLSGVLMALGVGYIPALISCVIITRPQLTKTGNWLNYLKAHLQQGKWLFYSAMIQWWAGNLFIVASGFFLGAAALGALRLVQTVFGVLNVIFQTFENYVLPQTANRMHNSLNEGRLFLKKIGAQSFLGVSILLLVLFLFSDQIIVLVGGEQFRDYGFLVKGMSVLYAIIFMGYPIRIAIRALVLNKIFFKGYVLTFIFGLLSSYLLLSFFNLAGAIAGLILSQLILMVYWQIELHKKDFLIWK